MKNSNFRICLNCKKKRPNNEPLEIRKFKLCIKCRLQWRQYHKKTRKYIQESYDTGIRLCTNCGKERPDDEPEEARKFKNCSDCRLDSRQQYKKKRKYIEEIYYTGISLCTKCGKERPDDEPEDDRKFKNCSNCRGNERNRYMTRMQLRTQVILPPPTPVPAVSANTRARAVSANTRARTRSRTNRASNSSQVRSTSGIQHNQNFAVDTDNQQTHRNYLQSGMISPQQETAEIQSNHARLAYNENTGAMDDPNNVGSSEPSAITYLEISSSDEDEINEISEEAQNEMANDSSSDFLETLKPDPALKCEYRKHFVNNDLVGFLERYIPDTMNKFDVCKIIVALGYPKESIKNYEHLTVSDTLEVLIDLMHKDVLHDVSREDGRCKYDR